MFDAFSCPPQMKLHLAGVCDQISRETEQAARACQQPVLFALHSTFYLVYQPSLVASNDCKTGVPNLDSSASVGAPLQMANPSEQNCRVNAAHGWRAFRGWLKTKMRDD